MNKKVIAIAVLPVVFGAAGFGAGAVLAPSEKPETHEAAETKTGAEQALDRLADEGDGHGAAAKPAQGVEQHDAKLIPAKAAPAVREHAAKPKAEPKAQAPKKAPSQNTAEAHSAPAKPDAPRQASHISPARRAAEGVIAAPRVRTGQKAGGQDALVSAAKADAGEPAKGVMTKEHLSDAKVVKLGRMMVPVVKAQSVTYVVSDIGVSMPDLDTAAHYNVAENAARLRDAILMSMHRVAGTSVMKGPSIDTEELSDTLTADLQKDFNGTGEVLFLSLYKADVPRS